MTPPGPLCWRRPDAWLDRRAVALPLLAAIALAFTSPLFLRPMNLGHGDWLWFHFIWDSTRKSYLDYREIPWWNPYYCGGNLGLANPNGFTLSPLFLLLLPLPTALAMKAYLAAQTFLGLWGTYELCRDRYGRGLWAVAAALMFSCSGYLGWHMNGQTGMANLHLLPWVFFFYFRGHRDPIWALGAGGVLASMLFTSGLYPCVISSVALLAHGLVTAATGRPDETLRSWRSGAIAAASAAAYSAVKMVGVYDYLRDHRRPIPQDDSVGWRMLIDALFVKRTTETQIWPHEGYIYKWWGEYGNYLGWAGVLLAAAGLLWGLRRRRREVVLVALFLGLVLGYHGPWSPYALLRSVPMMGNLRVPTRYWIVVDLWLACLASGAGMWLTRRISARLRGWPRWGALGALHALVLYLTFDLISTNGVAIFKGAMPTPPAPATVPGAPFRQVRGSYAMFLFPPRNQGTLTCFDELAVDISPALRPDLPSEAYVLEPDAGTVRIARWSPSEWRLETELLRPATVIINQNDFRGWRVDGGTLVKHRGLVAVQVAEGRREVRVWYRPRGYELGALLTLGSIAATITLLFRRARRHS